MMVRGSRRARKPIVSGTLCFRPKSVKRSEFFQVGKQADAAWELWQTGCLYGTLFAPACRRQARSKAAGPPKNRPGDSHPARHREIGKREKWTRSSYGISAS